MKNDSDLHNRIFLFSVLMIMARNIILYAYVFWVLTNYRVPFTGLLIFFLVMFISGKDIIIAYYADTIKLLVIYYFNARKIVMSYRDKILQSIGFPLDNDNQKDI